MVLCGEEEHANTSENLLLAAKRWQAQIVNFMLDNDVDVNTVDNEGHTSLHLAACEGIVYKSGLLQLLVKRGIYIEAENKYIKT